MRTTTLVAFFALALTACQSDPPRMSVEQASKVAVDLGGASSAALPPRTIDDIVILVDQKAPASISSPPLPAQLNSPRPPNELSAEGSKILRRRAIAGLRAGYYDFALREANQAVIAARVAKAPEEIVDALYVLELVLQIVGQNTQPTAREIYSRTRGSGRELGALIVLAQASVDEGDLNAATQWLQMADQAMRRRLDWVSRGSSDGWSMIEVDGVLRPVRKGQDFDTRNYADWEAMAARAHGIVAEGYGRFADAETWYRAALSHWLRDVQNAKGNPALGMMQSDLVDLELIARLRDLSRVLIAQDQLVEAEALARDSLRQIVLRGSPRSYETAAGLEMLGDTRYWQGKYKDADRLFELSIQMRDSLGASSREVKAKLAFSVAAQGRWSEADAIFKSIGYGLTSDLASRKLPLPYILTLYETNEVERGIAISEALAERWRVMQGEDSQWASLAMGLAAIGYARKHDPDKAVAIFRTTLPKLKGIAPLFSHGGESEGIAQVYRRLILESYLELVVGTPRPQLKDPPSQVLARTHTLTDEAIAEGFQVADALRVATTDRALASSVARSGLRDSNLAELARREQDLRQELGARLNLLAGALSQPPVDQNPTAIANLRSEVERLKSARSTLAAEITRRYPDYANLVNPPAATIASAQHLLDADEALVALYVGEQESYVWAMRKVGPIAFATIALGRKQMASIVGDLRKSVDLDAATLGDIPPFDVVAANRLYQMVLEPVTRGWEGARKLIVVADGALAQLPFALFVTRPVPQPIDAPEESTFSSYKGVPFLVRDLAVTQVPSVAAFVILRRQGAGDPSRRQFVGFGDPWFSQKQAMAAREAASTIEALAQGNRRVSRRAAPATTKMVSASIAALPPLPDTALEVLEIGRTLGADPQRDIFLGSAANERRVRTMKLDDRRVVMFATHGLMPGDLDGLSQPALALSAPGVAGIDGDGLLTMDKILGLKLDADWVVLSACNSGAGDGAGSEAISGLGRAFFYAGARALLVTQWPVETTSARMLTTEIFRQQVNDPALARSEALRISMLGLMDGPGRSDPNTSKVIHSYAHPWFWAPFTLVGDGR